MATIMASRCMHDEELNDPIELYTYGSPRVGWKGYVDSLNVTHHRWRNNRYSNQSTFGIRMQTSGNLHILQTIKLESDFMIGSLWMERIRSSWWSSMMEYTSLL